MSGADPLGGGKARAKAEGLESKPVYPENMEVNFTGVEFFREGPMLGRGITSKHKKRNFILKTQFTEAIHKSEKFLCCALPLILGLEMRLGFNDQKP